MQGMKYVILITALMVSGCNAEAQVSETPALPQPSPEATSVTVQTVVPSRYVIEGRLGEIGIAQTYYKIHVGQQVNLELSVMSKPGGSIDVNAVICRYTDGTKLYLKDLMARGPNRLGRCIGAFTVRFHGAGNDVEELSIPIVIDVIEEDSS